ncbi:hypothetical protein Ac2012v2_004858 [Leucoagaricus gongylophorus]
MDSAVKQLKVPELKRILADAAVAVSPRAKKDVLVTAVLDNKAALDLFSARHRQLHDPTTVPDAPASASPLPPTSSAEPVENTTDPELDKRKARAERFGIPLVNPSSDDEEKLKARAKRFGLDNNKKRPATEQVDSEELEKRRKRAERFRTKTSDAST